MVKLSTKQRYDFKKKLDELGRYKGRATELISLYIPPTKQISDVSNYLRNELSQSSNIKSKSTRKNVMAAIESIQSRLKTARQPPEHGLAFFVGHVPTGADQTKMVTEVVEPPAPIQTFLYRCDSYFYIDHLREMLMEDEVFGLVVVDRAEATIGLLKGKRIDVVRNIQSLVPSKHGRGGQSAQRFERLIEIAAHDYFKKVGGICTEAFLDIEELEGILIGGPGATKDFFLEKEYLHHELRKKVIDTFDTGYTDESGLSELLEKAKPVLEDMEIGKEKALMKRLFEEIRKEDGGLSAYGEREVTKALETGAVDILLVSEGMKMIKRTFECSTCGKEYVVNQGRGEEPVYTCPDDNNQCQMVDEFDRVDELSEICDDFSSQLELISTDSSEGEMLLRAFGGMAALLRYKVNFG